MRGIVLHGPRRPWPRRRGFGKLRAWLRPTVPAVPRARLLALGALGIAVLGGGCAVARARRAIRRRLGDRAEPEPLVGYAPTAPAAGSMLRYETEYPTIPYTTGKRTDRVAALIDRIERGETKLEYDGERGYLESLLAALEIDPSSQTLVYSQTSLQSRAHRPEDAARDLLQRRRLRRLRAGRADRDRVARSESRAPCSICSSRAPPQPKFSAELGRCLSCHDSYSLTGGGVPRFIVGSGYTGTTGMLVSHEGWILISDRTPLKSRWGGWYVTGRHGSQVHLGNMVIKSLDDFDKLEELRVGNVDTLDALVDVEALPHEQERHRRVARVAASGRRAEPHHARAATTRARPPSGARSRSRRPPSACCA